MNKRRAAILLFTVLVGFQSLFAGTFIEKFGKTAVSNTPWSVIVSPDKNIIFSHVTSFGSVSSSPKWIPSKGWFVFVQNDKLLWAFDGADRLLLFQIAPKMNTVYSIEHLPFSPPKTVMDRLPEKVRKRLPSKAKNR